ncbi:MAG: Ig-like domain-containing protein, partial [Planctomycetota bacterium]
MDQYGEGDYTRIVIEGSVSEEVGAQSVDFYSVKGSVFQTATVQREHELPPGPDPRQFYIGSVHLETGQTAYRAVIDAPVLPGDSVVGIATVDDAVYQSPSVEVAFGLDSENDGITDAVEANSPFGGDANRDGVLDHEQIGVTSVPTAGSGDFVTLDARGKPLQQVRSLPSTDLIGDQFSLPYGMFDFEVLVEPGGSAEVQIILPEDARPHTYYKQDEIGGTLVPFRYDGETGAVIEDNVITVHLVDGGRGDADGVVNGVIVDPGTPAEFGGVVTLSGENAYRTTSWDIVEHGGTALGKGYVAEETQSETRSLTIHEGDSFLVTMSRPIVIPNDPSEFRFEYQAFFDETDTSNVNDAFEVTLYDTLGNPVVESFTEFRDAFFNHTEGDFSAYSSSVTNESGTVSVDISSLFPGETYTLTVRLINNDSDTGTSVRLISNHAPTAYDDNVTILEDAPPTAYEVLVNDTSYPDSGEPLSVIGVETSATLGNATIIGGQTIQYTPPQDYFGVDTVTYTISDGVPNSESTATVTFNITPVNDAPVVSPFAITTAEDSAYALPVPGVLLNASDIDDPDSNLRLSVIAETTNGTLDWTTDGQITYTPSPNFNGQDSFVLQVNDTKDSSTLVNVPITVTPVNDVGGNPDSYATNEDVPLVVSSPGLLSNDDDVEGDALVAERFSEPTHGTVVVSADGSFTYTPHENYFGLDSFNYRVFDGTEFSEPIPVSLDVQPVNDAPKANVDAYITDEELAVTIVADGVLANDTDVEGDPISSVLIAQGDHGSVTLAADGSFTYTPVLDFFGTDVFTYFPTDGDADGQPTQVTVTVRNINDAPVAIDNHYSVTEDTIKSVAAVSGLIADDTDADFDALSVVSIVAPPQSGTLLSWSADGSFDYSPALNHSGTDHFSYQVQDPSGLSSVATAFITIDAVNDAPIAVADTGYVVDEDESLSIAAPGLLLNDTDIEGDSLIANLVAHSDDGVISIDANGGFQFTPAPDFYGDFEFTYEAIDATAQSDPVVVTISVSPVNDAPVATGDGPYLYVREPGGQLSVSAANGLLSNDSDFDGDVLFSTIATQGQHGTAAVNANGSFTYTPTSPSWAGTDAFTYVANDGELSSSETTVTVIVDHAPTANDDAFSAVEDTILSVPANTGALSNDYDVDVSDTIAAELIGAPAGAISFELSADGSFTYSPQPNFNGATSFTYRLWDGFTYSTPATALISVAAVNDAPVSHDDSFHFTYDGTNPLVVSGGVLGNDSDVEGDALYAVLEDAPAGTLVLDADGSFTYAPASGHSGDDTFTYRANDADAGTIATVTIDVNNSPVALDDVGGSDLTLDEDQVLTIELTTLFANDTDLDGDTLTASLANPPQNGTITRGSNGEFIYTPDGDFHGIDTFGYTISDGEATSDAATVSLTVTPVNDAPVGVGESFTVTEDNVLTVVSEQAWRSDGENVVLSD